MRSLRTSFVTLAVGAVAITSILEPASAQSAEEFFKGKTITAISEFGPEGTLTVFARMMAPYVEKYTGAKIVIESKPGGGGMVARNDLFKAKPDGLTLILAGHGPKLITSAMFKLPGARYEWSKLTPLGRIIDQVGGVVVAKNSAWQKPEDLRGTAFNYGESSRFYGPLYAEALGWDKARIIPGFGATQERVVAISRNELQAATGNPQTASANPDDVKLIVLTEPSQMYPGTPLVKDHVAPGKERWGEQLVGWYGIMSAALAPPGLPQDRVDFLEGALRKTWADPEFRTMLEKTGERVSEKFVGANELRSFMDQLAAMTDEQVQELEHVLVKKYAGSRP